MNTKWIQIEGGIEIPEDMTFDEFTAEFEKMIEDKGWHLLAFTKEVQDADLADIEAEPVRHGKWERFGNSCRCPECGLYRLLKR